MDIFNGHALEDLNNIQDVGVVVAIYHLHLILGVDFNEACDLSRLWHFATGKKLRRVYSAGCSMRSLYIEWRIRWRPTMGVPTTPPDLIINFEAMRRTSILTL